MVAVEACSHTAGGRRARAIASPTARTESTRERRIASRFCAVYRQFTERPTMLMTTSAPSSSPAQPARSCASQRAKRHGSVRGVRPSTTTSAPVA